MEERITRSTSKSNWYVGPKSTGFLALIGLLVLSLCLPQMVAADEEEPELELNVDPADARLVIHGVLDDQTTSFSGNVRLTVTGGDAAELRFLPDDVQHAEDENVIIDRTNVAIPASISLSEGQPRDVQVTVNNVVRPGDYTGELKFLLPDQAESEALVIPLEVHIDAQPEVTPVTQNLSFQIVRCRGFGCTLATWLLPDSVVREERAVQLDNQTLLPVRVTDAAVVLRGDNTGDALRASDVSVNVPRTLPAAQVGTIDVTLRRNQISADKYQGSIRFKLEDADDPVTVNVDLDVRDGPFWPLIVVVFGILVGRLVQQMETPGAKMQVKLLPRFNQLQIKAAEVKNPDARAHLDGRLREIKGKIDAAEETEQALTQELDKLEASIDFLASLEALQEELEKLGQDALQAKLEPQIKSARQALIQGKTEEAEKLRKTVEEGIEQAQRDGSMGGPVADLFGRLLDRSRDSAIRLKEAESRPPAEPPGGRRWNWLARLMASLAGARLISADVRYWLIRPLLWLVLLVVLVLLGLQTLYVNAGTTFGAAGVYDYLGLFLWGLSADVAQRTLQNVQGAAEGEGG